MNVVQQILAVCGAHAVIAMEFINSKPGEYLANIDPETNQLRTKYFASAASTAEGDEDIFTDPSKFYTDALGIDLAEILQIHPQSRVKNF